MITRYINTVTEWDVFTNTDNGIIIKFTADWCNVCRDAILPNHPSWTAGGWNSFNVDIDNEEIMEYIDEQEGLKVNKIPLFITKRNGVIKKMYQGKGEGEIKALLDDLVSNDSRPSEMSMDEKF